MATDVDCVVIGAGFGGLRMLYELQKQGFSARGIEAGSDVGGTWYWNRYPGARTDSEGWVYCFAFDDDLMQEWDWKERFPSQPEVHSYLRHLADRYDLRGKITFDTRVEKARWDDHEGTWTVVTDAGERITSTYLVCATGFLSKVYEPPFPGLDDFEGEWYQTSRWPAEDVDFLGKRVGVVGTGATGIQLIPVVAQSASHLTVFQRTPNYAIPGRNHAIEPGQMAAIKRNYDAIWDQARRQSFAFPMEPAGRMGADYTPEEMRPVFDAGWEAGGFRYIFETFDDLIVNQECNDVGAEFVREKIRMIVKDPATAELLSPRNHPVGGKRLPLGHFYYETFNRPNVSLVSIKDNPIERISPKGLRLADGTEFELDILIFAIGFDAMTGAMNAIDLRGRDDRLVRDEWKDGPRTFLGMALEGFPNMFMISGPQSAFANIPAIIDRSAAWVGDLMSYARSSGARAVEATPEAVEGWNSTCEEILGMTLLRGGAAANSWFLGANIPGKPQTVLFYFGGAPGYFHEIEQCAVKDYTGFAFA